MNLDKDPSANLFSPVGVIPPVGAARERGLGLSRGRVVHKDWGNVAGELCGGRVLRESGDLGEAG